MELQGADSGFSLSTGKNKIMSPMELQGADSGISLSTGKIKFRAQWSFTAQIPDFLYLPERN